MTQLKLDGKVGASAKEAIEPYVAKLYAKPGMRLVGIIELAHVERTQPAPDSDKDASVRVRITHLEIPSPEQEGLVREAQRALFLQRTAAGTLTDDGEIELSQQTLRLTAGELTYIELARLRAGLAHWADYARRVAHAENLTLTEIRHELDTVADGLRAVLARAKPEDEDDGE